MGTIVKRGDRLRAIVRLRGETKTATFPKTTTGRTEAKQWIIAQESGIVKTTSIVRGTSISSVLEKIRVLELQKPYVSAAALALPSIIKHLGDTDLKDCTAEWWVERVGAWNMKARSRACKFVRAVGALRRAERKFRVNVRWDEIKRAQDILAEEGITGPQKARDRRVSAAELKAIKGQIGIATQTRAPLADIIDLAVITGMRLGEICRITWDDLNTIDGNPMQWIRDRKAPKNKMGNHQNIPLLGNAVAILKRQPKHALPDGGHDARIFPHRVGQISRAFTSCARAANCRDLHFHDLRHEALSRLFEQGYNIPEVAKVSGHSSWKSLQIYTNLKAVDLHKGPAAKRAA